MAGSGLTFFPSSNIFIQPLYITNPESFLRVVRQKSFKIPDKQNEHFEKGRVRGLSGPKATSGYTRQLNTQQNFKTYKTNWSLFFLL